MPSVEDLSELQEDNLIDLNESNEFQQDEEEFFSNEEDADFLEDLLDFNFEGTTVKGGKFDWTFFW